MSSTDLTHVSMYTQPSKPIQLVYILEELRFGGTQKQMLEVAKRLDRRYFLPEIWTLRSGDDLLPLAKDYGLEVKCLCESASLRTFTAMRALLLQLKQQQPPLIHLCTAFPNVWGRIFGRLCRVPLIVGSCRAQRNVKSQHEKFLWCLAHAHICNAKSIERGLLDVGIPPRMLHTIANGVDTDFFAPNIAGLPHKVRFVNVARLVPDKDQETLIRAFAIVNAQIPQSTLHLVGDGPLRANLTSIAQELKIAENVIFHGASNNVREHLLQAQIFVLSSLDEGTPNAVLEAMSSGLPVVATAVNGVPDIVKHNEHGLLVEAANVDALAQSMLTIASNHVMAQSMGRACRAYVLENHSLEVGACQHEAVYLDLCQRAGFVERSL